MISKIYLDMDGFLTNFEKRYEELFGMKPSDVDRHSRESYFWDNWEAFVRGGNFETLDMLPDAEVLLNFARLIQKTMEIPVEILSSSGGDKFHETVTLQKKEWLRKHGIDFYPNIVNGGSRKALFALPDSVLIDDTERVINGFVKAGGIGILHTSACDTIERMKPLLESQAIYELYHL